MTIAEVITTSAKIRIKTIITMGAFFAIITINISQVARRTRLGRSARFGRSAGFATMDGY